MDMLGLGQGREGVVPADGKALQLAMLDQHPDVLDDPDVVILLGDEDLLPGDQIALDRSPALPGRSTLVFSAGKTSGAPKGASFSSSARGARTGSVSRLPPVKRVTVAVSGEGQAMGQ